MSLPVRRVAVLILFACGVALWWLIGNGRGMGVMRWAMLGLAASIGMIPPVSRRVCAALDRLRHPSPRTTEIISLLAGIAATAYFTFTAFHQDRDLFPKTHDESSYLLGMQMLARGCLAMPQHELADFFDTFYVIVRPVYASKYFPGTALIYTPTIWAGWPTWMLPVVVSGAIVGLFYRIVTRLLDGVAGLLAAILLASLTWFRMLSILLFSQLPMLLFGLLMVWAWMRWSNRPHAKWIVLVGAIAGWAAITRPVDALCYALPIGCAMAWDLWKTASPRKWALAGLSLIAGAAPFLALQLAFNHRVTGSYTVSPFEMYIDRDHPGTSFGFHDYNPSATPQSPVAQKREYFRTAILPLIERHTLPNLLHNWIRRDSPQQAAYDRPRLPMVVDTTMPFRVLLPLAFVGLLGLTTLPRLVLWLPLPLFIVAYVPYTFFLEHYAAVAAPAVIVSILLGGEALALAWPKYASALRASFTLSIVTLALLSTHEANAIATLLDRDEPSRQLHRIDDETFPSATLRFINTELPYLVDQPAVVLFRYTPGDNVIEEPVYNNAAAWPDDQPIIRAHDLGDRNIEIVRYYAAHQPTRTFYRFDRKTRTLTRLGTATSLLAEMSR